MPKPGKLMTLGELRALSPDAAVWITHTPHGVENPTYDRPVKLGPRGQKWEGEGLILDPLDAKDYVWSSDAVLNWWGAEGHFAVFHVEN